MTLIIGIDPGITGALAAVASGGWHAVADIPIKAVTVGVSGNAIAGRRIDGHALRGVILDFERQALTAGERWEGRIRIFCEAVHAREGDRNSMQSQGSLMRSLGSIEAVCDVLEAPAQLITPQSWQMFYGLVGKSHEQRAHGALPEAVQLAARLHPACAAMLSRVKDHNRAEALLIARYGLRGIVERGG